MWSGVWGSGDRNMHNAVRALGDHQGENGNRDRESSLCVLMPSQWTMKHPPIFFCSWVPHCSPTLTPTPPPRLYTEIPQKEKGRVPKGWGRLWTACQWFQADIFCTSQQTRTTIYVTFTYTCTHPPFISVKRVKRLILSFYNVTNSLMPWIKSFSEFDRTSLKNKWSVLYVNDLI